jgi:hypothetical protein
MKEIFTVKENTSALGHERQILETTSGIACLKAWTRRAK